MTQNRDRKEKIRDLATATGLPYTAAARKLAEPPRSSASATYAESRGWRVTIPETAGYGGRRVSWPAGRPWNDRGVFVAQVAADLECYGWDAAAWPDEITADVTIPLARNVHGHRLDEAGRLHQAAGVTYHTAHDAYIGAAATAVRLGVCPVSDVCCDGGEPREGWFRLGEDTDPGEDDGPSTWIKWRDGTGWLELGFDNGKDQASYAHPLLIGTTARPEQIAAAVAARIPASWLHDGWAAGRIASWRLPRGYDDNAHWPEDDGWDVSPALERCLVAYVGLTPPYHTRPL